jgi:hypothetical protein
MAIWYTNFLGKFGAFLPVLVICNKKNLATLVAAAGGFDGQADSFPIRLKPMPTLSVSFKNNRSESVLIGQYLGF